MKTIYIKLSILVIFCSCTCANNKNFNLPNKDIEHDTISIHSNKSNIIPLNPEFIKKTISSNKKNLNKFNKYVQKYNYPDYYGGNIISDDYILTFYIAGDSSKSRIKLRDILENSDFTIKACNFSLNELISAQEYLTKFINNKNNKKTIENLSIYDSRVNIKENCVDILLEKCTDDIILRFKSNVVDFKCLQFKQISHEIFAE